MRRLLLGVMLGTALLAGVQPLRAQAAKVEIFGGGSFARNQMVVASPTSFQSISNLVGWNASVTGNFLSWLGATADFSGHYNSPVGLTTMTFGPRLSVPSDGGLAPFTQATFGIARLDVKAGNAVLDPATLGLVATQPTNGFAAYVGGGLDWVMRNYLATGIIKIEGNFIHVNGISNNGPRLSFGVVLRVGRR